MDAERLAWLIADTRSQVVPVGHDSYMGGEDNVYPVAQVSADGTLLMGSGITSVSKLGVGRYNLITDRDISNCALIGTINTSGGPDTGRGSASILVSAVEAKELFVRTATPSADFPATVDDDRPFSVAVFGE